MIYISCTTIDTLVHSLRIYRGTWSSNQCQLWTCYDWHLPNTIYLAIERNNVNLGIYIDWRCNALWILEEKESEKRTKEVGELSFKLHITAASNSPLFIIKNINHLVLWALIKFNEYLVFDSFLWEMGSYELLLMKHESKILTQKATPNRNITI